MSLVLNRQGKYDVGAGLAVFWLSIKHVVDVVVLYLIVIAYLSYKMYRELHTYISANIIRAKDVMRVYRP